MFHYFRFRKEFVTVFEKVCNHARSDNPNQTLFFIYHAVRFIFHVVSANGRVLKSYQKRKYSSIFAALNNDSDPGGEGRLRTVFSSNRMPSETRQYIRIVQRRERGKLPGTLRPSIVSEPIILQL